MLKIETEIIFEEINRCNKNLLFVGDIGGTNSRFAVIRFKNNKPTLILSIFLQNKEIKNFTDTIKDVLIYLKKKYQLDINKASLAVAGIVEKTKGSVKLTNLNKEINANDIIKKTSLKKVYLLNDFEAIGYSLNTIDKKYLIPIKDLSKHQKHNKKTKIVIGAGTGLGQSILIWNKQFNQYISYPSEAGHGDLSSQNKEDLALISFVKSEKKKTLKDKKNYGVEWEDLISGRGIQRIYRFLEKGKKYKKEKSFLTIKNSDYSPILISKYKNENPLCKKTFQIFSRFYGRYIKNFVLSILPIGGIYLTGKLSGENLEIFKKKDFLLEIENNYKFKNLLKSIPILIITDYNVGLYGAAIYFICKNFKTFDRNSTKEQ